MCAEPELTINQQLIFVHCTSFKNNSQFPILCEVLASRMLFTYIPVADCTLVLLDLKGDTQQTKSDPFDEDETTDPVSTSPPDQELLHKMFVFRFKLMQFINSIHNYFMTRVSVKSHCTVKLHGLVMDTIYTCTVYNCVGWSYFSSEDTPIIPDSHLLKYPHTSTLTRLLTPTSWKISVSVLLMIIIFIAKIIQVRHNRWLDMRRQSQQLVWHEKTTKKLALYTWLFHETAVDLQTFTDKNRQLTK